jgi:hypothetical protein
MANLAGCESCGLTNGGEAETRSLWAGLGDNSANKGSGGGERKREVHCRSCSVESVLRTEGNLGSLYSTMREFYSRGENCANGEKRPCGRELCPR